MRSSVWPVGKDRTARLKQFHASEYWQRGKDTQRKHRVSPFWLDTVANIHTAVADDSITITSLSPYIGPQQLQELRNIKKARQRRLLLRAAMQAGRMGKHIPGVVWRTLWNPVVGLAQWIFQAHRITDEVRTSELAKEAFLKLHKNNSNSTIPFEALKEVPILAEQSESSLWMVLYISSVINTLSPYIKSFNINKIMEIGPGWGVLAISLHQLFSCRFILIDLPEVLNGTFAMISHYSPSSLVILPNEVEEVRIDTDGPDFILLCPEQTSLIPSDSVDLAINTSSFQEMSYDLIEMYFRLIQRCLRKGGLFYCLNEKVFERHTVGGPIEFEKYPWDGDFHDIFCEEFAFGRLSDKYERMHRLQVKSPGEDLNGWTHQNRRSAIPSSSQMLP